MVFLDRHTTENRNWRSGVLNGWVRDMGSVLDEIQPNAKLGVFYFSWYPADYDSALYRILGIDPKAFSEIADVMSPMLFHKMKERPTTWVGDYVTWLGNLTQTEKIGKPLIWPIVQSHNNPGIISPEEFRQVMLEGSKAPASGIMMFSDQSLVENPDKIKVMKKLYREEIK